MGCINKKQEIKSELQINDLIPKNKLLENKITTIIDTNEKNSLIIKKTEISLNNINPIIINEPKIICTLKNIENNYEKKLIITPNSINGHIIKDEEGKIYLDQSNDFNNSIIENFENYVKHCYISFNKQNKQFYINNKSKNYGLYKKINKKITLTDYLIISFGTYHIYLKKEEENKLNICCKNLNEVIYSKIINNKREKEITIGRADNCIIKLEDDNISRIQMTIRFEDKKWIIYDGNNEKESLNGIWVLANDNKMNIEKNDILKIGKLLFMIESF